MNKKVKTNYALLSVLTSALLLTGCGCAEQIGEGYTYNTYLETNPKTWNVHSWQTSDESYITGFTEIGFYDCILNDNKDGYKFVTEMASAFPKDVTKELSDEELEKYYAEKGNISSGYAWDIELNEKAVFENGDPITADDYIRSMQLQLDPKMGNFRADSYYASNLVIVNAERYYKQGTETIEALYSHIKTDGSFDSSNVCSDGMFYINLGRYTDYLYSFFKDDTERYLKDLLGSVDWSSQSQAFQLAATRIHEGVGNYLINFTEHEKPTDWEAVTSASQIKDEYWDRNIELGEFDTFEVMTRADLVDSKNLVRYTQKDLKDDLKLFVSTLGRGSDGTSGHWAWMYPLFGYVYNDFEQPWDGTDEEGYSTGVGLQKIDDYKIRLYLDKQISNLNLKFALSSNWLVHTETYEKLIVTTGGKKATNYASNSIDNYVAYGPYRLAKYENGKTINLEKNEKWYGYSDGQHVGQFQMTGIKTIIQSEHETVVQLFEQGKLDDLAMNKNDMKKYGNSSRKTTTYESYTQKISMNSNRSSLLKRQSDKKNKTILANDDFRKGLSLALNRNKFAADTTAGSKAFALLLNDLYLTDVELGEMYRNTRQGKSVYQNVYGKLGGDPYSADYVETALAESVNGYNFNMGVKYVAQALETELASTAEGSIKSGDTIHLDFRVYDNTSDTTIEMMKFITKALSDVVQAAVAKLKEQNADKYKDLTLDTFIETIKDENYYDTAKNGGYDFIFSIWGGAAINPYGLMQVYCDTEFESNCEFGFKGKQNSIFLEIDYNENGSIEANEKRSFHDWYTFLNNEFTEQDRESADFDQELYNKVHNEKLNILAGIEAGILNRFEAVPMVARGTSSLTSYKVENGSSTYISLVGYGGVRFLKFNYNDKEWNQLINSKEWTADIYAD